MNFAFTDEQEELRATARAFLAAHAGAESVRAAMQSELGHDPALWKRIGAELGWTAVAIPEAYGGLGLSWLEVVALAEVMGETLFCAPWFATVGLAASAILAAGDEAQKTRYLASVAGEGTIATLAFQETNGRCDADAVEATTWRREDDGYRLDGRKRHVVDGHCADLLVVAARAPGSVGVNGLSIFVLPAATAGVTRVPLPTVDRTRRLAEIELACVRVPASARLGPEGDAWPALERALALANVALAAELVGVAQRSLDLAVAYAKERVQFGRVIGSFQAIKHRCADMMVRLEAARSAAYWAGCVAADPDSGSATLGLAASVAKAAAADAAFSCAGSALQVFGGVGFTFEYDIQLYLKRARASGALLGDATFHRERVARGILS